jgi:hypothetical protein
LGPLRPQGQIALLRALPTGLRGFARGKITPRKALFHEKLEGMENVKRIYDHAEDHGEELNLYIIGEGDGEEGPDEDVHPRVDKEPAMGEAAEAGTGQAAPGALRPEPTGSEDPS